MPGTKMTPAKEGGNDVRIAIDPVTGSVSTQSPNLAALEQTLANLRGIQPEAPTEQPTPTGQKKRKPMTKAQKEHLRQVMKDKAAKAKAETGKGKPGRKPKEQAAAA